MKINNPIQGAVGAYQVQAQRKASATGKQAGKAARTDEVTLSARAQEILALKEKLAAAELPNRAERIAELKIQVQQGRYQVDAREVARKLLEAGGAHE